MADKLEQEIAECLFRKNLLEKKLANNFTVDSLAWNAELLEVNIRLRLLFNRKKVGKSEEVVEGRKRKKDFEKYVESLDTEAVEYEPSDDSDDATEIGQVGEGRKKRKKVGANEPEYDTSIPRTLNELSWLKDINNLKKDGKTIENVTFDEKPISYFFKYVNPVHKGSPSRGTLIYETTGLITNVEDASDPEALLKVIFKSIFDTAFASKSRPPDLLNVQFYGEGMGEPYFIPMRSPEQNNINTIVALFSHLSTSDTLTSIFNTELAIKVNGYWAPGGSGCEHDACPHVVPCGNTNDNFCLARAICYGKQWIETDGKNMANYQVNGLQCDTLKLMGNSLLDLNKEFYTILDAEKLLQALGPKYRLVIYNEQKQVILNTNFAEHVIVLCLKNNHFDFVPKLHLFLKVRKACLQCLHAVNPYSHPRGCKKFCFYCMKADYFKPCQSDGETIKCPDCFLTFPSQSCFDSHKETSKIKKNSLCSQRKLCQKCGKIVYKRDNRHTCNKDVDDDTCANCGIVHTEAEPFCYINPKIPKKPKCIRYIFFDIECQIIKSRHVPILLCSYVYCSICQDAGIDIDAPLSEAPKDCKCGTQSRYRTFNGYTGDSPVAKFLEYIVVMAVNSHKRAKTIIFAHNLSKYDGHLILEKLYEKYSDIKVVAQGFKLYSFQFKVGSATLVFKDSLNFFASPLKGLPKMFGFEEEISKKYFPHGYNLPENLHVARKTLPPAEDYWPDIMKPEDRIAFYEWYNKNRLTPFNLSTDMEKYCKVDVILLVKSCQKFRATMLEVNGIDCFINCSTIASYAYCVFRANVLKEKMLVNVPDGGYRKQEKQSEEALKFFRLYEREYGVQIEDASNRGEYKIPGSNYKADGVIRDATGHITKILEYNSCWWHGHSCYKPNQPLAGGVLAKELFEATMKRYNFIKKNYNIEIFWQCEVKKQLDASPVLKKFFNNVKLPPRIQLRDTALKGGRVEVFRVYYRCKDGEEIRFIDIVSLYPWVMKHCSFPLGNPTVLTWESFKGQSWTKPGDNPYRGFILCKVLAPRNIDDALLPYKSENGNLVFAFCKSCSDKQTRDCQHEIEDRAWTATFTHAEINEALKVGYKVLEIYEVWNYARWSKPGESSDLFGKYVNTFLSLKVESSGWPCDGEDERKEFIQKYKEKEGINLDPSKIEYNPAKRAVAKLMSNSLWGKLAQRTNLSEIRVTNGAAEFHKTMTDTTIEVIDFVHINDNTDRFVIKRKEEFQPKSGKTCVPVACFVTSYARLKLYSYLKMVPKSKIYADTDSLCYIKRKGEQPIPEGKYLGDMSREYGFGKIIEVIVAGPKNYILVILMPDGKIKFVMKVRGFPLDFASSQIITYEVFKEKVLSQFQTRNKVEKVDLQYTKIKRNKFGHLNSVPMTKSWQPILKKGFVEELDEHDLIVRPWGYKPNEP